MNVRIEAGVMLANANINEVVVVVESPLSTVVTIPTAPSSFFLTPLSISGHSISSVNPEFTRVGVMAAA